MEGVLGSPAGGRRQVRRVCAVALLLGLTGGAAASGAPPQGTGADTRGGKPPKVLFMCPHGAAKSVLASAYFQRRAKERGLNVVVDAAGTEPDATVSPAVAAHLKERGYSVPIEKPRKVTAEDLASADLVISLGCDVAGLPQPRGKLVRWDEVPAPSEGLSATDDAIRTRVDALVEELLRSMPKNK